MNILKVCTISECASPPIDLINISSTTIGRVALKRLTQKFHNTYKNDYIELKAHAS